MLFFRPCLIHLLIFSLRFFPSSRWCELPQATLASAQTNSVTLGSEFGLGSGLGSRYSGLGLGPSRISSGLNSQGSSWRRAGSAHHRSAPGSRLNLGSACRSARRSTWLETRFDYGGSARLILVWLQSRANFSGLAPRYFVYRTSIPTYIGGHR